MFVAAATVAAALRAGAAAAPRSEPHPPPRAQDLVAVLDQLTVITVRPHPGGYERSCRPGRQCVFGPAWSDDVDVAGGHNGCSTRDDQLQRDMTAVETKPGTKGCVVIGGTLRDPYTGQVVQFTKAQASAVNIDHVLPLAAAWDLGAWRWAPAQRQNFANDPRNLLAVTAAVNLAKGDRTPGEWSPPTDDGRCIYAQRYITVAAAYELPVTIKDKARLRANLQRCA